MITRLLPTFALVLALLIFFGYVNPTYTGSIAQTRTAIAGDDKALAAANAYAAKQNELAAAKSAIDQASLDRLDTFLPDSVDNVGIILDLNALAARSGLALTSADVAQPKTVAGANPQSGNAALPAAGQSPVSSVNLSLAATGPYSAFRAFLAGVEKSVRVLDVTDLVVKGSDTGVYTYQMTLTLYWLR